MGRTGFIGGSLYLTLEQRLERIDRKCIKDEKGCLVWTGGASGSKTHKYPQLAWRGRRNFKGNRLIWFLKTGNDPGKMNVLHKCDNPLCLNIDHLYLGTHKQNSKDIFDRNRHISQKQTHCKRGHILAGDNLKKSKRKPHVRICRTCANQLQIARYHQRKSRACLNDRS